MKLRQGQMFNSHPDVFIVTTNAYIRTDGALVMGRGAAAEATQRFSRCNYIFGDLVKRHNTKNGIRIPYGVIVHPYLNNPKLAIFQVKHHYRDLGNLEIIKRSTAELMFLAQTAWSKLTIAMNFPGTGNGYLNRRDVLPIIEDLPNNVEIWEYDRYDLCKEFPIDEAK